MAEKTRYRVSDSIMLRNDGVIAGRIGGKWERYEEVIHDWYYNSTEATPQDLIEFGIDESDDEFDTPV